MRLRKLCEDHSFRPGNTLRIVTHLRNERERGFDVGRTQSAWMRRQNSADAQDAHLSRLKLKWRAGVRAADAHQMLMIRQQCPCFQGCAASPPVQTAFGGIANTGKA